VIQTFVSHNLKDAYIAMVEFNRYVINIYIYACMFVYMRKIAFTIQYHEYCMLYFGDIMGL